MIRFFRLSIIEYLQKFGNDPTMYSLRIAVLWRLLVSKVNEFISSRVGLNTLLKEWRSVDCTTSLKTLY